MSVRIAASLAGLIALAIATAAGHATAATFTVNDAADTTDGTCGTAVGECTLREAIEDAVATAGRDTIVFDASVFPLGGVTNVITLTSPLPLIADGAGTVVDGVGAGVLLNGGNSVQEGLVFTSPPDVPLVKVTVANVLLSGFTGTAVDICGGGPPGCDTADVTGALVRNVVVNASVKGIAVSGRVNTKPRVVDSVALNVSLASGIQLFGAQSLIGARVERCTSRSVGGNGIILGAGESNVGATVLDSVAAQSGASGVLIFSQQDVTKAKVANVVTSDNDELGIHVRAAGNNTGASLSHVVASGNGTGGVLLTGDTAILAPALLDVVADHNVSTGISFSGLVTGGKITDTTAVANTGQGIEATSGVTGLGTDGTKITAVTAAANAGGIQLRATASKLQQVRADCNTGSGITLFEGGGGNTVTKSAAGANGSAGITVIDSSSNAVQKNVALGNGGNDLDDNSPACDANVWKSNVFRTGSQPCVQ